MALGLPLLPGSWVPHSPRAREQGGCGVKSRGLKPTSVSQYALELPQPYRLEVGLGFLLAVPQPPLQPHYLLQEAFLVIFPQGTLAPNPAYFRVRELGSERHHLGHQVHLSAQLWFDLVFFSLLNLHAPGRRVGHGSLLIR